MSLLLHYRPTPTILPCMGIANVFFAVLLKPRNGRKKRKKHTMRVDVHLAFFFFFFALETRSQKAEETSVVVGRGTGMSLPSVLIG